jgi:molybdopterin-guanine dinucleotide biosynthesis protein
MAIVVIGGHSRNVGKTSVVAGLIEALREYDWTAMKITQYGHGVCSRNGKKCHCATNDHNFAIAEEKDRSGASDTSRFLVAGARRVWWARTEQGRLAEAMPTLRRRLAEAENVIIESNSIVRFVRPDLYLTVLDPSNPDFKQSAQEFLDRADAAIVHTCGGSLPSPSAWHAVSLQPLASRPVFSVRPPAYLSPEIVEFVRARLQNTGPGPGQQAGRFPSPSGSSSDPDV